jgi:hypothetical protein
VLLFPARYTRGSDLGTILMFYVAAKLLETFDRPIFAVLHVVSGHTLKHFAAGMAGFWILRMVKLRTPVSQANETSARCLPAGDRLIGVKRRFVAREGK